MTTVPGFQLFYAAQALVAAVAGIQASYLFYRHLKFREPWHDAFVVGAQATSGIIMLIFEVLDLGVDSGMVLVDGEGHNINMVRFLGWFLTCPIQVAVLCDLHNSVETVISMSRPYYREEDDRIINQGTMMAIMSMMLMCATLMATAATPTFKVIYFLTGGVLCAYLFYVFGFVFAKYRKLVPHSKSARSLLPFFYGAWALFPLTAILSPYGFGTVSEGTAATMFALADLPAKNILVILMGNVRGSLQELFNGETEHPGATPPSSSRTPSLTNIQLAAVPASRAASVRSAQTTSSAKTIGNPTASLTVMRQQQKQQQQQVEIQLLQLQQQLEQLKHHHQQQQHSSSPTAHGGPPPPPPVPKPPMQSLHHHLQASSSQSSSRPPSIASGVDHAVTEFTRGAAVQHQTSTDLLPSTPQPAHRTGAAGSEFASHGSQPLSQIDIQRIIAGLAAGGGGGVVQHQQSGSGQPPIVILNPGGLQSFNQHHASVRRNSSNGSVDDQYRPRPLTPPNERGVHPRIIDASRGDEAEEYEGTYDGGYERRRQRGRVNWSSIPEERSSYVSSASSGDEDWRR